MTDEEIVLEYEMHLASEGNSLKTCFKCKRQTHREICPDCNTALSGDARFDAALEMAEEGDKDLDLDKLLRGDGWEPV